MVTGVAVATETVVIGNVALMALAGSVTLPGTTVDVVTAAQGPTTAPPDGAGAVRVIVP